MPSIQENILRILIHCHHLRDVGQRWSQNRDIVRKRTLLLKWERQSEREVSSINLHESRHVLALSSLVGRLNREYPKLQLTYAV